MKKFSLSYNEKLHSQRDFNAVFKKGRRLKNKALYIIAYKRDVSDEIALRRMGLVTSKKVGKAHDRNKVKRRLREIFRTNKHLMEPGLDIVFISGPETASQDYNSLKKIVLESLEGAGLYKTGAEPLKNSSGLKTK